MKIIIYTFCSLLVFLILIGCSSEKGLYLHDRYEEGLREAKRQNKPIFIHFTGYGIGYDEFGRDLITQEDIKNELIDNFVCIELLIDDRTRLTASDIDWVKNYDFSEEAKDKILRFKNIANLNMALEKKLSNKQSQPLYTFFSSEEELLVKPQGYTGKNPNKFLDQLRAAKEAFKQSISK